MAEGDKGWRDRAGDLGRRTKDAASERSKNVRDGVGKGLWVNQDPATP
jgi:hypothetical protein